MRATWTARLAPRRLAAFAAGLALLALLSAAAAAVTAARASLPRLDGRVRLDCLEAPATVERDARGFPRVTAASRLDLACALGFLHGQERFFQMDLLRRRAAGRLAELFGAAAVPADAAVRPHRFEAFADRALAGADVFDRALLERYAAGVRAGVDALGARPPEYLLLRAEPEPWEPAHSVLTVYAMYLLLQDSTGRLDEARGALAGALPPEVVAFLAPAGTDWDAPLDRSRPDAPPLPGPDVLDFRAAAGPVPRGGDEAEETDDAGGDLPGSNAFAVSGSRTDDGRALLAVDMHLPLGLPNTWYPATLVVAGNTPEDVSLSGVTLPGAPSLIAGSNGSVAWGFTNSYGDHTDVVELAVDADGARYRVPDGGEPGGWEPFEIHRVEIGVRGEAARPLEVRWTRWGPALPGAGDGPPRRALQWVAHEPGAADLGLLRLERVRDAAEALALAPSIGMPTQNLVVADAAGSIGWTPVGPLVAREGCDGRLPAPRHDGACRWRGLVAPEDYPAVLDPPGGAIWTANNRVASGAGLAAIGDGGYDLGARAAQIRDRLDALGTPVLEGDLLRVQLDDHARFLERWRGLLRALPVPDAARREDEALAATLRLADVGWTGRAAPDDRAFRLVRAFRIYAAERAFAPFEARVGGDFRLGAATNQEEAALWRLVTERPAHLLAPEFASWDALLLDAARAAAELLRDESGAIDLDRARWGARNTVTLHHPLARAVPALARWLSLPPVELPGDAFMPRVQTPTFGASQRMVVAPGRERSAIFHMPGGASGHFLSPHYAAGNDAWIDGRPAPLLPGPARSRLDLVP